MLPLALVGLSKSPWAKGAAIVFLGLACVAVAFVAGHRSGSSEARAKAEADARKALEIADRKYRQQEADHAKQISDLRLGYARLAATEAEKDRAVVSDLDSGAKRVRVRAARCAPVPTTGAASVGADAGAEAELPSAVGARLYDLAADADETARQLTALQAWAKEAVRLCGGGRP